MKEFLYWEQVQQRLTEHLEKNGVCCSFYDATKELWEEGAFETAEDLPRVSFENWDVENLEEFDRLFGKTPVDLFPFHPDFRRNISASKAAEPVVLTEVIPFRFACDQAVGVHLHASFEVIYLMTGEAVLECDRGRCTLEKGTLCILSPNLRHDVVPQRGSQVISVMLAAVTLQNALNKLLRQESVLSDFFHESLFQGKTGYLKFCIPEEMPIRKVLRSMFHEHYSCGEYASQICASYAEILFAQVLRQCGNLYERHSGEEGGAGVPSILAVLKYIQRYYRTKTLSDVAEHFHYESSYLGKLIKFNAGKSYTEIVRELRLQEAKRLLTATEWGMDQVAEQAGYHNQVHFFREFKAFFGETPGAYRKRKVGT